MNEQYDYFPDNGKISVFVYQVIHWPLRTALSSWNASCMSFFYVFLLNEMLQPLLSLKWRLSVDTPSI